MGTRSLTHIIEDKKTLTTMYRQFDGYLSGHGNDLAEFLKDFKVVNGYSGDTTKVANGMGCLTAQLIAHFKEGCGNIYIHPPNTKDCWEEYDYTIYLEDNKIKIKVVSVYGLKGKADTLFDGTPEKFLGLPEQEKKPLPLFNRVFNHLKQLLTTKIIKNA